MDCDILSSPDTLWVCLYGLEHSFRLHGFIPTWPCLIINILATYARFFEPSSSQIWLCCMFICVTFKSHIEWSNARVSTLTTMILPTAASTCHFSYMLQTSTYQNFLTHPSIINSLFVDMIKRSTVIDFNITKYWCI